jgi:hypothetical protein
MLFHLGLSRLGVGDSVVPAGKHPPCKSVLPSLPQLGALNYFIFLGYAEKGKDDFTFYFSLTS